MKNKKQFVPPMVGAKKSAREIEEERIRALESKVMFSMKGMAKQDIRQVCGRIARKMSELLSREKQIVKLQRELKVLRAKK